MAQVHPEPELAQPVEPATSGEVHHFGLHPNAGLGYAGVR